MPLLYGGNKGFCLYRAVVIMGKEFKVVKIECDEELIQNLIAVESDFWNGHVVRKVMPEPDGSKISDEIISRYFPTALREEINLPTEFDGELKRRADIMDLMDKLEQEQIDQRIKLFMGDYEVAANEFYRITWSNVDTVRIDSKRLKQEMPELYRSFSKCSQSRRFTIKAA